MERIGYALRPVRLSGILSAEQQVRPLTSIAAGPEFLYPNQVKCMSRRGPFGLWMGMSVEELGGDLSLEEVAPCKFRALSVPKPHSAFEKYILEIAPRNGLGWIKAIGRTMDTNPFGSQLISAFEAIEGKLASTYGKYEKTDFLMYGSIWDEPRDWMQGLANQERILMAAWTAEHGSTLHDSLKSVALLASALDSSSGYIAVEYSFENAEAVEAEIAELEDDAL